MAFKGREDPPVDFANLIVTLNKSGLNISNQPLFQTIYQLITKSQQSKDYFNQILQSFFGRVRITEATDLQAILILIANINSLLENSTFWTELDESLFLKASRKTIAGTGITLDYSVPNEVTISSTGGSGSVMYMPLTDGVRDETQDIYAVGDHIMVAVAI